MFPTIGASCNVTVVVNMGQNSFQCMLVVIANQVSFYNPCKGSISLDVLDIAYC